MDQIVLYIILFGIIVLVGHFFRKSRIPISLLLVIIGMLLSLVPSFPEVTLNPNVVLDIFLPLLVYQISSFTDWHDVKKNLRPIALLSVGHVVFITVIIAMAMHALLPQLGWGLAFILGAVISPPDDVAIVSIAEKIRMPRRIITILKGEGMFNDAAALILFRFALVAVVTNQFSLIHAVSSFFAIIIGETLYGLALGYIIGELRSKIRNSSLHIIASILTPFAAYLLPVFLGGSGVLATVITGFIIGNRYSMKFTPEFRLVSRAVWPSLAFALQSILFLLVGLDLRLILTGISSFSYTSLAFYGGIIVSVMIIGRFIWVYCAVYFLPRFLFPSILKKDPYPPWQYPFIVSWSGMRGGISLAAALAVPHMSLTVEGANSRDFIIFLVFCAITATLLLQGLSLPWLLKRIGIYKYGQQEQYKEHLDELGVRLQIVKEVLRWLDLYKKEIEQDKELLKKLRLQVLEYKMHKTHLQERIEKHKSETKHSAKAEAQEERFLTVQIIEVEKEHLFKLYREEKISLEIRNRLLDRMDHRISNLK